MKFICDRYDRIHLELIQEINEDQFFNFLQRFSDIDSIPFDLIG